MSSQCKRKVGESNAVEDVTTEAKAGVIDECEDGGRDHEQAVKAVCRSCKRQGTASP